MKAFLIVTLFTVISLWALPAQAGNEGGTGGDGVELGTELYLIDLVESGLELDPYFDMALENDPSFKDVEKRLEKVLGDFNDADMIKLVAIKLIEISKVHTPLALTLLHTIESYRWVLVNHVLVDVKDEDTVLELGAGKLVQLAIRRLHSVLVSRDSFPKLDVRNRAALIFHEATYANVVPKELELEKQSKTFYQSSPVAREVVGVLFSKDKKYLDDVTLGIGLHSRGVIPPENYYENIDSGMRSWGHPGTLAIKVLEKRYDRTFRGPERDILSNVTAQQFCGDISSFGIESRFDFKVEVHFEGTLKWETSDWGEFRNEDLKQSVFLEPQSLNFTGYVYEYRSPKWNSSACEEKLDRLIKRYKDYFKVRNVFWK